MSTVAGATLIQSYEGSLILLAKIIFRKFFITESVQAESKSGRFRESLVMLQFCSPPELGSIFFPDSVSLHASPTILQAVGNIQPIRPSSLLHIIQMKGGLKVGRGIEIIARLKVPAGKLAIANARKQDSILFLEAPYNKGSPI
ncbi:hypothetical protein ES703_117215 [subsurface metagenome]